MIFKLHKASENLFKNKGINYVFIEQYLRRVGYGKI